MRELIPFYGVYSLLFADHGLSTAEISALFVIWSVTSFVAEVPSGAWADTVSRRGLLVLSGVLYAVGFALWVVAPSYLGFAAGFVLWGVSGALASGTFEALLYDELALVGATPSYARLMGYAHAAAMTCSLAAILLATPLMARGGYVLVGWLSVGVAVLDVALAWSLPGAPKIAVVEEDPPPTEPHTTITGRYVGMLREGVREAARVRVVRGGVLLVAAFGLIAYDEYFGLLARDGGTPVELVPLLVGLTAAGQVVGTALAGRTARMSGRTMTLVFVVGAVLLGAGAMLGGAGGFGLIAVGYGALNNAMIVSEARLQDAIGGPARATVTSVAGLGMEVFALACFGAFALGTSWWSLAVVVAIWSLPLLGVAIAVPRWLPAPRPDGE